MSQYVVRKCLLILGMHRSGTSALSGALHLAGMNIGNSIMPPKEDNPRGFFENDKITALNDRILEDLYARWNDTTFIPEKWWNDNLFEKHRQKLIQILKNDFVSDEDIMIKDPRISVLLPFHLHILLSLNIQPAFLICIRNPIEVTASLIKRNHLSPEKIQLLWMDHELKAEYYSRSFPRMFITYHDFLEDPISFVETAKKTFSLQIRPENDDKKNILQFVSQELSHFKSTTTVQHEFCHEEVPKLYTLLVKASKRDLSLEEMSVMDTIRTEFIRNFHFYNGLATIFKAKLILSDKQGNRSIIEKDVSFGKNTLTFDLRHLSEISEMVLFPCNARVGLQVLEITALDPNGNKLTLTGWSSNAEYEYEDKTLVFEMEMPQINIELKQIGKLSEIHFDLRYQSFGRITYRMGAIFQRQMIEEIFSDLYSDSFQNQQIKSKKQKFGDEVKQLAAELVASKQSIAELQSEMEEKDKRIAALFLEKIKLVHSLTWITGKIITYPFRLLHDFVYKKN